MCVWGGDDDKMDKEEQIREEVSADRRSAHLFS